MLLTHIVGALVLCVVNGYQLIAPIGHTRHQLSSPIMLAGKGFGKPSDKPLPKPKKKSPGAMKRDAAGAAFDELTSSGAPEYIVSIRTISSSGDKSQWMPVGGIAVPRSNSEDKALSMAIFNNEDVRSTLPAMRFPTA